ncbi:MAG: hypothetical protein IK099_01500, partial [Clostridia bacterium]|nr:hypothetical protein [Clostridia bacterium]
LSGVERERNGAERSVGWLNDSLTDPSAMPRLWLGFARDDIVGLWFDGTFPYQFVKSHKIRQWVAAGVKNLPQLTYVF